MTAQLAAAQGELAALYGQMERLNRLASIGTIAGMIAHEFNNILTPVMSYSQMALAAPQDRELAQKALAKTLAGSERAAKIADAILSFARDEGADAKGMFHVEQHDGHQANVGEVVRDALSCLAKEPGTRSIGTETCVPGDLVASIHPIALQQVLVNLILNARDAMSERGGRLEIGAARCGAEPITARGAADSRFAGVNSNADSARSTWNNASGTSRARGPWVCITVRDSGRGMAQDQLARLFTPFDSKSHGTRKGTGLGMVITKRLIERAGGWLTIESARGRGTTTNIFLSAPGPNKSNT